MTNEEKMAIVNKHFNFDDIIDLIDGFDLAVLQLQGRLAKEGKSF